MSLVPQTCPACAAPVVVPPDARQLQCSFCDTQLAVEQNTDELALIVREQLASSLDAVSVKTETAIQSGTSATQAELRRLQLSQELSNVQVRLGQIQSEIRAIQRIPQNRITRQQLTDLRQQERSLKIQADKLTNSLYPQQEQAVVKPASAPVLPSTVGDWLTFFFSFNGRISRPTYWIGIVVAAALFSILLATNEANDTVAGCIGFPAMIGAVLVYCSFTVRRYHDRGKSGWWSLLAMVPLVGPIVQIVELGFLPGTSEGLKYDTEKVGIA